MNKSPFFIAALSLAFLGTANAQTTAPASVKRTAKGAVYQIFTPNTGDKIKVNDVITFNVIQKTEKDSVLYSSFAAGRPVKLQVQPSQNVGDLMDIFPLLALKDSALVKVPTDSIFVGHEEQRPPFLPKGSNIVFVLKVERVQSLNDAIAERNAAIESMKADEKKAIAKYVTDNHKVYTTTLSGLKYIITQPSIKRKALKGDTVFVNYTGRTLDGKVFDSSVEAVALKAGLQQPGRKYEPIKVAVGAGEVIKGWDEALLLLREGSKASLLIPSDLAYGERGAGDSIPGFSPLLFDIEVVKIKAIPHPVTAKKPVRKTTAKKTTTTKK